MIENKKKQPEGCFAVKCNINNKIKKKKERPGSYLLSRNCSTIGVRVLDFRVRDGNGYDHSAMTTRSVSIR